MKRRLVRTLTHLEWLFDTLVGRLRPPRAAPPVIDPYLGYATSEHWVARGRVLTRLVRPEGRVGQRRGRNLLQMLSLFLTDEVAEVTVTAPAHGVSAVTDEEGYFTLLVPGEHRRVGPKSLSKRRAHGRSFLSKSPRQKRASQLSRTLTTR